MDPPQLGQLLEQMTEVMTQLARNRELNEQCFANNNNNNNRNGRTTLRDFLQLNPRTFASSSQPLDADDWLGEMNRTIIAANVSPEDSVVTAGPRAPLIHDARAMTRQWMRTVVKYPRKTNEDLSIDGKMRMPP